MKKLYLDCAMGAAGDMLMAALLELTEDREAALSELNGLGLPGVEITAEPSRKCGILGTHVRVRIQGHEEGDGHHHHSGLGDIRRIISRLTIPDKVRADALAVYEAIAQAEGQVHGCTMEHIHFHEVGAMDAVADVVGVCWLLDRLGVEEVHASAVHVGSGQVACAHGILPVPAPATAYLLREVPIYSGTVRGELCTPTGAALLKHFVTKFGPMDPMRLEKIGYGMGKKDFEAANCLRAMLGQSQETGDEIEELSCNLDDMPPEDLAFAMERLLEGGALDAFTTPIGMKKSRPGVMLTCLCRPEDREAMTALLFRHTTTLGIRRKRCRREVLDRSLETRDTPWGPVQVKTARGWGVSRSKAEYEDLARISRETGLPLARLRKEL
ncbi:MAG: nickel pincer cofactor biosynthesis protein LarC [Eubacteriales bacterium]|nr:nickel pincer cofactor biosynthesis protein LarC [Eubacteriales bacterium]